MIEIVQRYRFVPIPFLQFNLGIKQEHGEKVPKMMKGIVKSGGWSIISVVCNEKNAK